jgi:hypothetical protein
MGLVNTIKLSSTDFKDTLTALFTGKCLLLKPLMKGHLPFEDNSVERLRPSQLAKIVYMFN